MTNELVERYQGLKDQVEERTSALIRLKERKSRFQEDLETFKQSLKDEGVDPDELDSLIAQLEKDLDKSLKDLEKGIDAQQATPS